jgi:hypothetical protein
LRDYYWENIKHYAVKFKKTWVNEGYSMLIDWKSKYYKDVKSSQLTYKFNVILVKRISGCVYVEISNYKIYRRWKELRTSKTIFVRYQEFFFRYWGLNSGPTTRATLLAFLMKGVFEIGSLELFSRLASNCSPPDLCLLS